MIRSSSMSALSSLASSIVDLREWRTLDSVEGRVNRISSHSGISALPISPHAKASVVETSPPSKKSLTFSKSRDKVASGGRPPQSGTTQGCKLHTSPGEAWDFDNELVPWPLIRRAQSETDLQHLCRRNSQPGVIAHFPAGDFGRSVSQCQEDEGPINTCFKGWVLPSPIISDGDLATTLKRRWTQRKTPSFTGRQLDGKVSEVEEDRFSHGESSTSGREFLCHQMPSSETCPDELQGAVRGDLTEMWAPLQSRFLNLPQMGRAMGASRCPKVPSVSADVARGGSETLQGNPRKPELPPGLSLLSHAQLQNHPEASSREATRYPEVDLNHKCSPHHSSTSEASTSENFGDNHPHCYDADGSSLTILKVSASGKPIFCNSRGCGPIGLNDEPLLPVTGKQVAEGECTGEGGHSGGILRQGNGGGGAHGWGGSGGDTSNSDATDKFYQQSLVSNPGHPLLLRNYARFLCEVRCNLVKAEEYYERAILANPGDGEVLAQYAKLIWEAHRDQERAASYFDQAIQASPGDCFVLAAYASFLWSTDSAAGEPASEQVERHHPEEPPPILPPASVVWPTQC